MNLNNMIIKDGLVKAALQAGKGELKPLTFDWNRDLGVALMNPSIYNDKGQLRSVVRCVNYTLHHSERGKYPLWSGPLQYTHAENDVRLATENFIVDLDNDLNVTKVRYVYMKCNVEPKWEFHGLEDARLFRWNGKLYMCGVRRDTTDNGQGRMELSEIELNDDLAVEKSRTRIPAPGNDDSYCEKNWMPILDRPFEWVKWSNPTELVHYNTKNNSINSNILSGRVGTTDEIRGGTHVVPVGNYYIAFGHSVRLWKPYAGEKDSEYTAHAIVWDKNFNLVTISPRFRFLNARIEFQCGLAMDNSGNLIISFAEMDNEIYLLRMDTKWLMSNLLEI